MTIEAKLDETNALLRQLLDLAKNPVYVANTATPSPTAATPPVKPAKVVKEKAPAAPPVAEKPAVGAPPVDDFSFDAEPEVEEKKLTVDDARKALVALQKAKQSPEASRKILTAAGFTSLAGLKDEMQEKIKTIIAECNAQMPK